MGGMPLLSHQSLALVVVLVTLIGAWPNHHLMWSVAFMDGMALLLIYFPDTIDDLTFGLVTRGGPIDAHTPPWMISFVGWLLILLMAAVLYTQKHALSHS
jgi:hypothetical protein